MTVTRESIKNILTSSTANVVFVKKDGTERSMNCTLMADLLPPQEIKENAQPRKENEEVLAVYDLDKRAWRSFRIDAVKSVSGDTVFDK